VTYNQRRSMAYMRVHIVIWHSRLRPVRWQRL